MENLMDVYAVAERLAVNHGTIRRLIATGEMECYRVGRAIRVSQEQIDAYLNRQHEPKALPPRTQSLHSAQPNWNARSMQPMRKKKGT